VTDVDSGSRRADPGPERFPAGVRLEDPGVVRAWTRGATAALRRERGAIDRVNVFPVADADTGTNLYLTLREGDRAVAAAPADSTGQRLLAMLARAALLGARGNSGVILSEWLRGLAVAARRGGGAADLFTRAAMSARSAVARPAEGTILTAADAAAAAARDSAGAGGTTPEIVTAAAAAARTAARASRDELDVLRAAGVLDAGALGLVLVLDALAVAVAGAWARVPDGSGAGPAAGSATPGVSVVDGTMDTVNLDQLLDASAAPPATEAPGIEPHGADPGAGALELMFVLTGPAEAASETVAAGLRRELGEVGDSVVVVGGDAGTGTAVWQAHVHTDHLDRALDIAARAARAGSLAQVHVRHLAAVGQHEWGVVAATSAPGLAAELARAGAVVLLTGGLGSTVEALTPDDVGRAAPSGTPRSSTRRAPVDAAAGAGASLDVEEVVAVPTPTDLHAVVALAALGTALPIGLPAGSGDLHTGDPRAVEAHAVVADALAALTVVAARGAAAVDALREAAGPGTAVATALLDADASEDLPGRLAAVLAERAPDAELVVLATGRPGDEVHLGTEEVDA
jgi:hypothetical protein